MLFLLELGLTDNFDSYYRNWKVVTKLPNLETVVAVILYRRNLTMCQSLLMCYLAIVIYDDGLVLCVSILS